MDLITKKLGVEQKDTRLLYTIYFAFFATGMVSTLLGTILPNLKEAYNINYWMTGNLFSFHQMGNLFSVIFAGILPYFIGRKKTSTILFFCMFLGLLSITLSGIPSILLIAYALTGIGRGAMSNISNVVVSNVTKNKTAGLNILHAVFAVGAFLSPFILISLLRINSVDGWRFTIWFILVLIVIILFLFITSTLKNTKELSTKKVQNATNVLPFYKSFDYWLNTLILGFYICGEAGCMGWLVTYFKDAGLMGQWFAQITSGLMWIMIMCGRLICASISDKMNKNKFLFGLTLMNTLFFILMISTRSMPLIIIGLLGTGLSMSGIYPTTLSTMKPEYSSSPLPVGIAIGVGTFGGIFMPTIVGGIAEKKTALALAAMKSAEEAERIGVSSGISAIAVALTIMVLLVVVKNFTERRKS